MGTATPDGYLPDKPGEYSDDVGGYRQRWLPGAFGDREDIADVHGYRVLRDEWTTHPDGSITRDIIEAKVTSLLDERPL